MMITNISSNHHVFLSSASNNNTRSVSTTTTTTPTKRRSGVSGHVVMRTTMMNKNTTNRVQQPSTLFASLIVVMILLLASNFVIGDSSTSLFFTGMSHQNNNNNNNNNPPLKSLSTTFRIRDRTMNNRSVMKGVLSVNNMNEVDDEWSEVSVFLRHSSSNITTYYHNGQMVHDHGDWSTGNKRVCLNQINDEKENIPPLHLLRGVFLSAEKHNNLRYDYANHQSPLIFDREVNICRRQKLDIYVANFAGQTYVICVNEHTGIPVTIIGRDLLIDVLSFNTNTLFDLVSYRASEIITSSCPLSQSKQQPRQPTGASRNWNSNSRNSEHPWFLSYKDSCRFNWIKDPQACQQFDQRSTGAPRRATAEQKVCIFLHGVGNSDEISGPPAHEFPDYWGNVHEYTPQCSERWFIREETKRRGWDSTELQMAFCKLALVNQTVGDNIIRNKTLFVHSMGNLVLAGAIRNGYCDIDMETTSWYEIQGPFSGSKAAGELETICLYMSNGEWVHHFTPRFVKWVATTGGYCVPGTNHSYPAYNTLGPSYEGMQGLVDIAIPRLKGAMCGESAYGLNSLYSAPLYTLSMYVGYGDLNDGMVPWRSCQNGVYPFTINFQDKFYLGSINHADGTCRNGNGMWGSYRQPCSWYTDKL